MAHLSDETGLSLAELGLRFLLAYPDLATVIPGAATVEQLEENVRCSAVGPLPSELHARLAAASALLIADPVHNWGPSALCHLFIERSYPFLWSGKLSGMPFASISCASTPRDAGSAAQPGVTA